MSEVYLSKSQILNLGGLMDLDGAWRVFRLDGHRQKRFEEVFQCLHCINTGKPFYVCRQKFQNVLQMPKTRRAQQ